MSSDMAAAPADAGPKKRLVIKKMVLENFKSYAGAQHVGPFHKVRSFLLHPPFAHSVRVRVSVCPCVRVCVSIRPSPPSLRRSWLARSWACCCFGGGEGMHQPQHYATRGRCRLRLPRARLVTHSRAAFLPKKKK